MNQSSAIISPPQRWRSVPCSHSSNVRHLHLRFSASPQSYQPHSSAKNSIDRLTIRTCIEIHQDAVAIIFSLGLPYTNRNRHCQTGYEEHGHQEGWWFFHQRTRLGRKTFGSQGLWGSSSQGRIHHYQTTGPKIPSWRECGHGQGPHAFCQASRNRQDDQAGRQQEAKCCACSSISLISESKNTTFKANKQSSFTLEQESRTQDPGWYSTVGSKETE